MTILTIIAEVETLRAAHARAALRPEAQIASLNHALDTAISAALADPANSTTILDAAENKFSRYASADILLVRQANTAAGVAMDAIVAANAPAAVAASTAAMASATATAQAAMAVATAPTGSPDLVFAAEALSHPDRLFRVGLAAHQAHLASVMGPAHAVAISV